MQIMKTIKRFQPKYKHHTMPELANLIAVVGGDTSAHEERQRAREPESQMP